MGRELGSSTLVGRNLTRTRVILSHMDIAATVLFTALYLAAIVGVIVPVLPGVVLAAGAALLAAWMTGFAELNTTPLVLIALLTALSFAIDYIAGAIGAKRFGARRAGIIGSVVGALLGIFFFPPFGFLFGALGGAVVAELITGRELQEALRAGVGVLVGTLSGVVAQIFILIAIGLVVFPRLF